MSDEVFPVAIIGGGAAGVMASLRCVLNNDRCLFFPGNGKDRKKSRAQWVARVENMPGYAHYKKGIIEPNRETLDWIRHSHFQDNFVEKKNRSVDFIAKKENGLFSLTDNKGETYLARFVVLCTGVMDVQPKIKGEIDPIFPYANAQTVDYCIRCDGHHSLGKKSGVIGHTSGAVWVAVMLMERYQMPAMTVLTHGQKLEADEEVLKLSKALGITVREEEIVQVLGDAKEGKISGFKFASGEHFDLEFCFVSLGMIVYNQLAAQVKADLDERGFVITDQKGHSSVDGLYIAGDLRAGIKKQIYTAWDSAVDSLDAINGRLRVMRRKEILG